MEVFKPIKEYPMYSISSEGRIIKNSTRKMMKPSVMSKGYMQINLFTNDGRRKKELVHRLVAITFIPNENHLPEVNHIDGVRHNNTVSNLEWVTRKENVLKSSLPRKIMVSKKDGSFFASFNSEQEACDKLNLTLSNVSACLNGNKQKTHKGYTFKLI